jgi:pimeloyl-ACP methyl ester carboxylesterase
MLVPSFLEYDVDIGIRLRGRDWPGDAPPFVLVHGLSSNARTWDQVAGYLAAAGHRVVAFDQRGHGLSEKPDQGYDSAMVAGDLARLIDALSLKRPVIAGQSWGGSVVLHFGATYPGRARGLVLVDGGTTDLQSLPNASWESVAERLRPPNLAGTPRQEVRARIETAHPDWTAAGVDATLANFEILPDGTVHPWLTLDRHMRILRSLWEQRVSELYPRVQEPVLICLADTGDDGWTERKREQAVQAGRALPKARVVWFSHTDHDIHVHRPTELAKLLLELPW